MLPHPLAVCRKEKANKLRSHLARWENCQKCLLSKDRHKVVFFRGTIPAKYLFIGEAPGKTEDFLGFPFVGDSGHYLQSILHSLNLTEDYAITNTISCLPMLDGEIRTPSKQEINACSSKLEEMVALVSPKYVIALGKIAAQFKHDLALPHPAFILRCSQEKQPLEETRFVTRLSNFLERHK